MSPWKKVSGGSRGRGSSGPTISLRKSGSIGINREAVEEWFEGSEGVELFFDEENNRLGLKPVEDKTRDAYTLSLNSGSGSVVPKSFLKRHDLIPEITTHYDPIEEKLNGDTEIIAIDLGNPTGTYGSPSEDTTEDTTEE